MNKYIEIDKENNVKLKRTCKWCVHIHVCKFHSKQHDLAKTNEMYSMTEYLEWNNILQVFEENVSCRYYDVEHLFTDQIDHRIIELIISDYTKRLCTKHKLVRCSRTCFRKGDVSNEITVHKNGVSGKLENQRTYKFHVQTILDKYKLP